ncbi:winged helix-turn-helix transcriptional regulator [Dyadobacter sandarakinus]|uniref:Helix-turn-helix transcriptional regulator n=1 Tax=Dyadobacter sandarakinus TaxID=2747268 RepID=A0ABX7I4H3_9BACT|nr:helix-turn-helix domain-containing protein [Dyadobacter sandarakinus]QRR00986.1 helix-turn-helix transcriptional regulator [Dyadobacter sandarakinus]
MSIFNNNSQRKPSMAECNARLNAVGDALYVIGGKWMLRIIIALSEGNRRFNDIQRAVPGISPRVLSNELKNMELNGFVRRNVYTDIPVVIEYELTAYSATLDNVLTSLMDWGQMHRERIRHEALAHS